MIINNISQIVSPSKGQEVCACLCVLVNSTTENQCVSQRHAWAALLSSFWCGKKCMHYGRDTHFVYTHLYFYFSVCLFVSFSSGRCTVWYCSTMPPRCSSSRLTHCQSSFVSHLSSSLSSGKQLLHSPNCNNGSNDSKQLWLCQQFGMCISRQVWRALVLEAMISGMNHIRAFWTACPYLVLQVQWLVASSRLHAF